MNERREFPRLKIPLEVEYQVEGHQRSQQATLVDLSAGGAAMMTEDALPTGGDLAFLRFRLDTADCPEAPTIEVKTRVIRCDQRRGIGRRSEYLVGVRFLGLADEDFAHLRTFVDERVDESGERLTTAPRVSCDQPIAIQYRRFDDFVSEVAMNLSLTGMFIRAKKPRTPGSILDFSFQLGDDFELINGQAEVVWTRPLPEGDDRPAGMGIRFLELDEVSQRVLEQIVEKQSNPDSTAPKAEPTVLIKEDPQAKASLIDRERRTLRAGLAQAHSDLARAHEAIEKMRDGDLSSATGRIADLDRRLKAANHRAAGLDSKLESTTAKLAKRIEELRTARESLENHAPRLVELEASVETLTEERESTRQLNSDLDERLTDVTKERDQLREEAASVNTRASKLEAEHQAAAEARDRLQVDIESRSAESKQLADTTQELERQVDELKGELGSAQRSSQELQEELDRLRKERNDLRGLTDEIEDSRSSLETRLAEANQEADRELRQLRSELEETTQRSTETDARISELEEQLREGSETLEGVRKELSERQQRSEELEKTFEQGQEELARLERRAVELQEQLDQKLEAETRLDGDLSQAREARDETTRQLDSLRIAMEEIQDEAEQRVRAIQEQSVASEETAQQLRGRIEHLIAEKQTLRDDLERSTHDRSQAAAKYERVNYEMEELLRETEKRREGYDAKIESLDEAVASALRAGEAAVLEVEHKLELANQRQREERGEVETTFQERDELQAKVARLTDEVESVRGEAAEHDRALREEIAALEATLGQLETDSDEKRSLSQQSLAELEDDSRRLQDEVASLRRAETEVQEDLREAQRAADSSATEAVAVREELDAKQAQIEALREDLSVAKVDLSQRADEIESLQAEIANTGGAELSLREEIATLGAQVKTDQESRDQFESEHQQALASTTQLEETNRELQVTQRSLIANQERLEEELAESAKQLEALPAVPGRALSKPPAARPASLRAAALVAFGLILGFVASYPFETVFAGGETISIRPATSFVDPSKSSAPEGTTASEASRTPTAGVASVEAGATTEDPSVARPSPQQAVERWAAAWAAQQVPDYLRSYASNFEVPDELERGVWELQRTRRIQSPESITVEIGAMEVVAYSPDATTLSFNQSYVAGLYSDRVRKTLDLVWENGAWRISRESSEPF